jgi:homoserine dehydrogenase
MENADASFEQALRQAQELGYAEADPTDDVEGYDARAKLAILCAVALQAEVQPKDILTKPITLVGAVDFAHAKRLGCTIRQISQAQWDRQGGVLRVAVRPALVRTSSCSAAAMAAKRSFQGMARAEARRPSPSCRILPRSRGRIRSVIS